MKFPKQGEIYWLNFNPQKGHEQAGKRPALVVSDSLHNQKTGLAFFAPITGKKKDYLLEVSIPEQAPIQGAILVSQTKSLDFKSRQIEFIGVMPENTLNEVLLNLRSLF